MNPIRRVFRYEFARHFRARSYLFFTVAIPLIAIASYFILTALSANNNRNSAGGAHTPSPTPVTTPSAVSSAFSTSDKIGIIDQSGLLTNQIQVAPLLRYADQATAEKALLDGELTSFYLIPADYLATGRVELWMNRFNPENDTPRALQAALNRALAAKLGQVDPAVVNLLTMRLPQPINTRIVEDQATESASIGVGFVLVYVFVFTFMFGVFLASGLLMQSVVEERESRIVEILISSMRPSQLLTGKILALGLLGLLQLLTWAGAAFFIMSRLAEQVPGLALLSVTPTQLVLLIVYYILGYLLFAGVYAGVGAVANNMREGPQLALFFTFPAMFPLYFAPFIAAQPDSSFAVALSIFPITSPLAMTMRISVSTIPPLQLALSLSLLFLTAIMFMWAAGRVFRFVIMLSGQPPKLRDLPRLIREGR